METIIFFLAGCFVMTLGLLAGFLGGLWALGKGITKMLTDEPHKVVNGIREVIQGLQQTEDLFGSRPNWPD